jgi:biotin operon repressor
VQPCNQARPLYLFQRANPILAKLAKRQASGLSKKWNLWTDPFEPKTDAIRPIGWVFEQNPSYRLRETFGGDLRASIIQTIQSDQNAGVSELELARRCKASRDAIRKALDRLERYGHVERVRQGRNLSIVLADLPGHADTKPVSGMRVIAHP